MSRYMLISSRDPFSCGRVSEVFATMLQFKRQGHEVCLFLVENGVLAARAGASCAALSDLIAAGVTVLADEFALRQRALPRTSLAVGVSSAPIERIMDALAQGVKTIWH